MPGEQFQGLSIVVIGSVVLVKSRGVRISEAARCSSGSLR